ncbi:COG1470 family protein [Coleofasciculus sp.]|uniref:COG1470 family protein n=1 Tax=Coleofasciculus sp. TaxID=3100458 RepID=UPI003A1CFCDA
MNSNPSNPSANSGKTINIADILALPERQRQIALFIRREEGHTLPEIADHINENEQAIAIELDELVQEGFVREIQVEGIPRYYRSEMRRQGSQFSEMIQQALTPGKPLSMIVNPSGDAPITPGSTFELCVTITNEGNQSALIEIYIDETSQFLHQWCISPYERLALGRGQSSEVVFQIPVPLDAIPGTYNYLLMVDAQQHYPQDTPIQHQARLQVLPFVQEAIRVNDPTFTLLPLTNSAAPAVVQPGEFLEVQVLVHNRSDRVDQFRLTCPDLAPIWYRVIYPEGYTDTGVVRVMDGLELNPGEKGQIQLIIMPPVDTWASIYSPTVRLYSLNNPDLVLLDAIYLQVMPIYLLTVELVTLVGKVSNQLGVFELQLYNGGNITRDIALRAKSADGDDLCTYTLIPTQVRLAPGGYAIANLEVQPSQKWWRRPFYGRVLNFVIEIEDLQQFPLINNRFQGTLIWEGRPWWQFLLVILGIVGLIGALIFLLWFLFFRPKPSPEIIEFAPAGKNYSAAYGESVRLNWEITNPQRLQTIKIQGVSPDGVVTSGPIAYNFSRGIPNELERFCTIDEILNCQNVPTDAREPGDYVFELTVIPQGKKRGELEELTTNTVKITPFPIPEIEEFASTQPVYQEVIQANPETANQEASPTASENNSPENQPQPENLGILLNWKISHPEQIRLLKLVGRNSEGIVTFPMKTFDFSQGIPKSLQDSCEFQKEALVCMNLATGVDKPGTYIFELIVVPQQGEAEELPTQKTEQIKVEAQPVPFEIVYLTVIFEGQEPLYQPKLVLTLPDNPENQSIPVLLSWKVEGGRDLKVELLPAPGTVPPEGTLSYELSPEPTTETITLQVTNEAGEQKSRSVTIETVQPPPPEPPATTLSPPPSPPGDATNGLPILPPLSPPGGASDSQMQTPPSPSPSPSPRTTPSETEPKPLRLPPGGSPPLPPGADSPPPAELPPKFR